MSDIFQSDYEQLEALAARFGQQSEQTEGTLATVKGGVDALAGGGWQGQGSEAFVAEMEGEIFPATERLAAALAEAQAVTLQIKQTIQQAEEDASAPFRGGFSGAPVGTGGSVAGGLGSIGSVSGTFNAGVGLTGSSGGGNVGANVGASGNVGSSGSFLEENPMVGFRLFGFTMGSKNLINMARGLGAGAPIMRSIPVAGGVIGTGLELMKANANGEDMAQAVGREVAVGTLKTEVYLVPGLNVVAGGGELLHMFGVTDTNYTDKAVRAVAEPVHKYALDPASDVLAEGIWQTDRGIRWGWNKGGELIDDLGSLF